MTVRDGAGARAGDASHRTTVEVLPSFGPVPATGARLLRRSLGRHRGSLAAGYLLITCWQIGEALVPVLIGAIVDRGVATGESRPFLLWCLALCGVFLVFSFSYRWGSRMVFSSMQEEEHLLRVETAAHVLHPRGARTGTLPGETLSLATSDCEMVAATLRNVAYFVSAGLAVLVAGILLVRTDVWVAVAVLVGVPLSVAASQVFTPLIARRTDQQMSSIARASGLAADFVAGLRPLKGSGGEDVAVARYRAASRRAAGASMVAMRAHGYLLGMATTLSTLLLAVVALVAGTAAARGDLTLGELISVVGLAAFLAEPIRTLGYMGAETASALASARRIVTFLQTPRLVTEGEHDLAVEERTARLSLERVSVGGLSGLDLEVAPGEMVAVVTEDPAASDAIIRLVRGEVAPDAGTVRLGGHDLADLTVAARRRLLLVSAHEVDLFEGTLHSNVDLTGTLDVERLEEVLAASAAADVVGLHPDGLEQPVSPRGSTLSGGQRQRVALARSLAVGSPVLVLQDPSTAVDAVTEQRIALGLKALRHPDGDDGRATVVLTSSPALLDAADRVVLVRDGRVAAEGHHRDLLADESYAEVVVR